VLVCLYYCLTYYAVLLYRKLRLTCIFVQKAKNVFNARFFRFFRSLCNFMSRVESSKPIKVNIIVPISVIIPQIVNIEYHKITNLVNKYVFRNAKSSCNKPKCISLLKSVFLCFLTYIFEIHVYFRSQSNDLNFSLESAGHSELF
jgi:hypothetical protein